MKKFTRGNIERFLEAYASDAKTLDIGAGGNDHLEYFPNRTTLDIDPQRIPDVVGDAQALQYADASWDVIVCSEVLEHIPDPRKAVAEMYRVLKPGGMLILTTRFAFPVHDAPGDYWRFTPYTFRLLFEKWNIVEIRAENGPFKTIAVLLQRIIFQSDLRGGKFTKSILYLLALFFDRADRLVRKQYGDIKHSNEVDFLLSSGIYIACKKPL